MEKHIQRIF